MMFIDCKTTLRLSSVWWVISWICFAAAYTLYVHLSLLCYSLCWCLCVGSPERSASSRVSGADRWPRGHLSLWSVVLSGDTCTRGNFLSFQSQFAASRFCSHHLHFARLFSSFPLWLLLPLSALLCSLIISSCFKTFTPFFLFTIPPSLLCFFTASHFLSFLCFSQNLVKYDSRSRSSLIHDVPAD